MQPYFSRNYSNFPLDGYKDLVDIPVTVLERFEWPNESFAEGGKFI